MSKEGENPETKPFDSEYYQWSKQINESKKVCSYRVHALFLGAGASGSQHRPNAH